MADLAAVQNGDASSGVRIKLNSVIRHRNTWADAKTHFGAVGDGVADDTSALQAAADSDAQRVLLPAGTYKVSQPIKVPSGMQFVGVGPHVGAGTVVVPDLDADWPTDYPDRGVLESDNFSWTSGDDGPGFWTQSAITDLQVRCHAHSAYDSHPERVPDYGVVVWAPNEETTLRRLNVQHAGKDGFLLGGFMSVLQVEDCSSSFNGRYGVNLTNHPDAGFASGIGASFGGRSSGGSIRFFGISGDGNIEGLIAADGSQIVECLGLKSENNLPAIRIKGSGVDSSRQRWTITGFRFDTGTDPTQRDFVLIEGTAEPQVIIGSGACYNAINLLNDTVRGVQVAKANEGFSLLYDPGNPYQVVSEKLGFFGSTPVVKPASVPVTAAGVHAALVSLGLISA